MAAVADQLSVWFVDRAIACNRSYDLRSQCLADLQRALRRLLALYHPVFCYANALERVPHKMRITNREDFDKLSFDLHDLAAVVTATPVAHGTRISCDKNIYRVARILHCVMNSLIAIILTYAAYFVDNPLAHPAEASTNAVLSMQLLVASWGITTRCCPRGVRSLERAGATPGERVLDKQTTHQHSSLNPLADFPWIADSGFGKLSPISEHDLQAPAPPLAPPSPSVHEQAHNVSQAQLTRFFAQSAILPELQSPTAQYLALQKNLFSYVPDVTDFAARTCFQCLKHAAEKILAIRLPLLDNGWLTRCLDHGRDNLRAETLKFLLLSFAHDLGSVSAQRKMDLPTQTMVWSSSPIVRRLVADTLIVLAYQLPYKDGAFKRFIPLLLSKEIAYKRMGIRLFTQCRAINLTALSLAIRILITYAIAATGTDELGMWLHAAADLAQTNASFSRKDCVKAVQEFWSRSFDPERTQKDQLKDENFEKAFLVFSAFALTVLSTHCDALLKEMPMAILDQYDLLQRLLPERLTLRFCVIAPTRMPLALKLHQNSKLLDSAADLDNHAPDSPPGITATPDDMSPGSSMAEDEEAGEEGADGEDAGEAAVTAAPTLNNVSSQSDSSSSSPTPPKSRDDIIDLSDESSEGSKHSGGQVPPAKLGAASNQRLQDYLPPEEDAEDIPDEPSPEWPLVFVRRSISTQFLKQWRDLTELPAEIVTLPSSERDLLPLPLADPEDVARDGAPICMVLALRRTSSEKTPAHLTVTSPFAEAVLIQTEPGRWRYSWNHAVPDCNFEMRVYNLECKMRLEDSQGRTLAILVPPRTSVHLRAHSVGWQNLTLSTISAED